ncbi:transaldolase [Hymenobacter busanensis]|uniref:Glucose-6-phosphate isomerase n=1 Tax=Hymenobacter busanensis TaxID=2607656 RepID=A0A7L4ZVL0_9BACT|nr:transaldolase [Hymenobacter busanensis]KAA9339225.1 transaldolase [Hymenobacter busanensis]QHJ07013.1 transaldolase [Hymenobacter busanensis]
MSTPLSGTSAAPAHIPTATFELGSYQAAVDAQLQAFGTQNFTERFWQKDATLWTQDAQAQQSIRSFMGWLRVAEDLQQAVPDLEQFVAEVKAAGFSHVVVMGMGGSTMAPIVFRESAEQGPNGLNMLVLDTTDPGTIQEIEQAVPLAHTLFIVASKSGTTAEPLAFGDYFYARLKEIKGERAGENFIGITDPGTPFVATAEKLGYRRVFLNFPEVGGRFSALTYFGLVPAALYGLDVREILTRALHMMRACGANGPAENNPGEALGVALGVLAQAGHDKLTLLVPPSLSSLGLWMEQLVAESTGKEGLGILPIADEPLASADYGLDRVFVYVGYKGQSDAANEQLIKQLREKGHPIITILMNDVLDLGQEFFRWEVATAVASAVFGINPFDQPNVQAAKTATDKLMKAVEEHGELPQQPATLAENGLTFYASHAGAAGSAAELVKDFFGQAQAGDYLSVQAYLTETPTVTGAIQQIRAAVLNSRHIATTAGYGPRFLHSTGQYHKGGPNTGLFLQLTADNPNDLPLPGRSYTFGTLKNAQAQGDLEALHHNGRRTLRVHLGADAAQGLQTLLALVPTR